MLKIDPAKNSMPDAAPKVKSSQPGGDVAPGENSGEEYFDSSDFATVMENLAKKDKATAERAKAKPAENKPDQSRAEKPDDNSAFKNEARLKENGNEETAGAAAASKAFSSDAAAEAEFYAPPARSILHIADLERIVSSIRANTFEGQQQVLISLKNSVLDGLQIRLTTGERGRIVAEFIAANEKIKNQVEARSDELAELLRRRGVELSSLKTSLDSNTSDANARHGFSEDAADSSSIGKSLKSSPETDAPGDYSGEINDTEKAVYRA